MAPHRYRFEPQPTPAGVNMTGVWMIDAALSPPVRYALVQHLNGMLTLYGVRNGSRAVFIAEGRYIAATEVLIAGLAGHLLDDQSLVLRGRRTPAPTGSSPIVSLRFRRRPGGAAAVCVMLAEFLIISPDPDVRHHIAQTLGRVPEPAVVDALLPVLEHPDAAVRFNAIEALWNHVDDRLVAPMVALVRCFLAGDRPPAALWGTSQILFHLAHTTDAEATAILMQVVHAADLSDDLRITAANSLLQQNRRHGVQVVVDVLPGLSEALQERLARLLFDLNDPILLDYLPSYLTIPDAYLRLHAAGILSHLGHPTALDVLVQSVQTSVYPESATYLGGLSDPRSIPALIKRLPTAPPPLRAAIFHALGRLRDARTTPIFDVGLQDPEPTVKRAAAGGLAIIQTHFQRSGPAPIETDGSISTTASDAAARHEFALISDALTHLATHPPWARAAADTETLWRSASEHRASDQ
jgi:HEAT repeat protein